MAKNIHEKVKVYFDILKLLEKKPMRSLDIQEKLTISESTLHHILKRLKNWKQISKLEDGTYASIRYQPNEELIIKKIRERQKISLPFDNPVMSEEILEQILFQCGLDPKKQENRDLYFQTVKENFPKYSHYFPSKKPAKLL